MEEREENVEEYEEKTEFEYEDFKKELEETEGKDLEVEDIGKSCSLMKVEPINTKKYGLSHLATLKLKNGEKRKKWLSIADKKAIGESKSNDFIVGKERRGSQIYLILKVAGNPVPSPQGED